MNKPSSAKRPLLLAVAILAALGPFSGPAAAQHERAAEVVFVAGQHRIVKGNEATVTIGVRPV